MVKTYCVKKRKQTKCVQGSERYEQSKKNNRLMIKCTCASYGITKTRFVKSTEGGRLDIQKTLAPLGELHLRTLQSLKKLYNYCGPGTDLKKRLERGDKGLNRLDEVCKQHGIDYDNSDTLADKHVADQKMIQ